MLSVHFYNSELLFNHAKKYLLNGSFVGISNVTLKIGLFHLLVTDCFMYHIVIVDRYKYKWLRRDSLCICNEFPLLSYIF